MKVALYILSALGLAGLAYWLYSRYGIASVSQTQTTQAPAPAQTQTQTQTTAPMTFHATAMTGNISTSGLSAIGHFLNPTPPAPPAKPDFNKLSADARTFLSKQKISKANTYEVVNTFTWTGTGAPPEKLRKEVDAYLKALCNYDNYVISKDPNSTYINEGAGWPKGSKVAIWTMTIREKLKQVLTSDQQQQHRSQAGAGPMPGKSR
jgi:hypothetical protein